MYYVVEYIFYIRGAVRGEEQAADLAMTGCPDCLQAEK